MTQIINPTIYAVASGPTLLGGEVAIWSPTHDDDGDGTGTLSNFVDTNDGTLTNFPSPPTVPPNASGWTVDSDSGGSRALIVDGSNDHVISGSNISGMASDFAATISVWWKPAAVGGAWRCVAGFMKSGAVTEGFAIFAPASAGSGSVSVGFYNARHGYTAAGTISTGSWYHIAITKTPGAIGAATTKMYINNVAQSLTFTSSATPAFPGGKLYLCSDTASEISNAGRADNVRIYNRAITAGEVSTLYNGGTGRGF